MRDHGDETESTVSRDGITVYQTYEEERFGVPTVVLKFVSERDDTAEVRVAVGLPPDLHIEEVGFHPDYRREDWTVDSDRLTFAAQIGPREEVTTMYAVESLAADQLDSLLDSLSIERVAGESGDSGATDSGFDPHPSRRSEHTAGEPSAENVAADDLKAQVETYPAAEDAEGATADAVDFGEQPAESAGETDDEAGETDDEARREPTDADGTPGEPASESPEAAGDSDTTSEDVETEPGDDEPLDALGLAEIDEIEDGETGDDDPDRDTEPGPDTSEDEGETPDEDTEADGETSDAGSENLDTDEADGEATEEEKTDLDTDEEADVDEEPDTDVAEKTDEETDGEEKAADEERNTATVATGATGKAALSDYSTAELVAELDQRVEAGGFTDDDRGRLYELLLGESDGATVSDELRLAHLQKRVSDLEASMEGINEFDARHGPPAEAFTDLEEKLATLGDHVETLDREVASTTDEVERLAPRLDGVEDDVDSLAEGQEALETRVSTLREWRERVKSTLQALGDQ